MNLDLSRQAQAALDVEGPVLVLGGPGSGKTTLALLKMQQLKVSLNSGQEVLFLSFSRAAVQQVIIRCRDILTFNERKFISVKTYHSFCMELLKTHGKLLTGKIPRIIYPMSARLVKSAYAGDWEAEGQRLACEEGRYCFEQFAPFTVEILRRSQRILELITNRYPSIILDEFQDTDESQWELVKLLSQRSRIIALADPDQRIFDYDSKVDPERLNHLRNFLKPSEFDLGGTNHRSPDTGILKFANAVLRNELLPQTEDVRVFLYNPKKLSEGVHAQVVDLMSELMDAAIPSPTVAVLCRSNSFVVKVSAWLQADHYLNDSHLIPVDHYVIWDADLTTAAAQVVGSIMEWPQHNMSEAIALTLHYLAIYYDLKNAEHPNKTALAKADSYRRSECAISKSSLSRKGEVKHLVSQFNGGITFEGKPEIDWLTARKVLDGCNGLREVLTSAQLVPLYRAKDELSGILSKEWVKSGSYRHAADLVRRALEARQLISANIEPSGFVLMNIHKAKGKEFDGVVLVEGIYDGRFFDQKREDPPFNASRRLLRVGISRARHLVHIVCSTRDPWIYN